MMKVAIVCAALAFLSCSTVNAKEWWENGNYYQIYPRSFKDSDGDGIGDLNGVSQKLQYLKDIGFTAAWLSPIFKSPMVDFGYDVSNFYEIHPEYGTMEDFENLLKKAKEVGIKIILDFVPNHSSDECEWFQKSVNGDPEYRDFYIWNNGKINATTGQREPPSNWVSAFRYSAWEWNEVRQQYYLHQFAIKQPDLNYRNPAVVRAMKEVMRFWLKKGIAGFRIDALPFMFEKDLGPDNTYPDEPVIADVSSCPDPDDECHWEHIYTQNQPESVDMVYQWRELMEDARKEFGGDTRLLLTEAYTTFDILMTYYGNGVRNGSHIPFNFDFLRLVHNGTKAPEMVEHINKWLTRMPAGVQANWVLGNHDNSRLATKLGIQRADLYNILLQTLPGNAVTYYGEELAMTDVFITWEGSVDPQACNTDPISYVNYSRDPERTPYQWDASRLAGFTNGDQSWLPVADNYKTNNALIQSRMPKSHLQIFKKLIKLRKEPTFQEGSLNIKALNDDVIIYSRTLSGSDTYVVVLNLGGSNQSINLNSHFQLDNKVEVITSSVQSKYIEGQILNPSNFTAEAYVGIVLAKV